MSAFRYESQVRPPLVSGDKTYHQITVDIVRPIENRPSKLWWIGFLTAVLLLCFGIFSVTREVIYGTGQWNLNKTVGWGWDITNFVWWVGIGHAGTLISAILLLFRQGWRTGVNRAAEAMTIFAVMCAGQFPIWHMGRVWMFFFILPYPNTSGVSCGLISIHHYSGMYLRYQPISPFLYYSGIVVCYPIWPPYVTGQN